MKSLKWNRESRNLTQKQLADNTGLSALTVSNIETQSAVPTNDTRQRFEQFFGVRINWLETLGLTDVEPITWESAEASLRKAILASYSLNEAQREQFITVAQEYINTYCNLLAAEEAEDDTLVLPEMEQVFKSNKFNQIKKNSNGKIISR